MTARRRRRLLRWLRLCEPWLTMIGVIGGMAAVGWSLGR